MASPKLTGGGGKKHGIPSGAAIAHDALGYAGKVPYVYGGGNPNGWDCSGFVNWVLGHDFGMTLPGGVKNFSGSWHGPAVVNYAVWTGAKTIKRADMAAGDLVIWPGIGPSGHIGIVTSKGRYVSALDTKYGTIVTQIAGSGPHPGYIIRRVKGAVAPVGATTMSTSKVTSSTSITPAAKATCLIATPSVKVLSFGTGGGCLFTKTNARAVIGAMMFPTALGLFFWGTFLIVAHGLGGTRAGQAAGKGLKVAGAAVALVPGGEAVGAGIAAGGQGVEGVSKHVQARRQEKKQASAQKKEAAKQAD